MSSRSKRGSSEYYFQPQTKKLVNDESQEYRKSIYEKTMQKLKDGAKLIISVPKPIVDVVTPTKNVTSQSEVKRGLKQISLTSSGQLDISNTIINPKEYCSTLPEKCCFCERLGCFTNLNQCPECQGYFCDNCSFSTYALGEYRVCKSCFR